MDWQGQKLAEALMQYLLLGSALAAFSTGYLLASYRLMLIVYLSGVAVTFLVTVPDWPFFNSHPLQWAEPRSADVPSTRQLKLRQQQGAKKPSKPLAKS